MSIALTANELKKYLPIDSFNTSFDYKDMIYPFSVYTEVGERAYCDLGNSKISALLVNQSDQHNKYYLLFVGKCMSEPQEKDVFVVYSHYGRIGTNGIKKIILYNTYEEAKKAFSKQFLAKLKKNYIAYSLETFKRKFPNTFSIV